MQMTIADRTPPNSPIQSPLSAGGDRPLRQPEDSPSTQFDPKLLERHGRIRAALL
jgi:hypothetical protein